MKQLLYIDLFCGAGGGSNIDIKFFFAYGGKIIGNIHDNPELLE